MSFMAAWIILAVVVVVAGKRRRWRRWESGARMGPRWGGPSWEQPPRAVDSGERDAYVDQLETRVARLEERLDFTEKLLMERGPAQKIE